MLERIASTLSFVWTVVMVGFYVSAVAYFWIQFRPFFDRLWEAL